MALEATAKRLNYRKQLKEQKENGLSYFTKMNDTITNIQNMITTIQEDVDMDQTDVDDAQAFYDDIVSQLQNYVNTL